MKYLTQLILILVIFLKTGNLLSANNLFSVNNILLDNEKNLSNKQLANEAIKKAFRKFTKRVVLKEDLAKFDNIDFSNIKDLIAYYNVTKKTQEEEKKINFSITFDKDKIHNLFYSLGVAYSDIVEKELYILPILLDANEIFIFSSNYYYENWSRFNEEELIEFILPLENIEIIQKINQLRNNLIDLNLNSLFKEYEKKNVAIVLIEQKSTNVEKIYFKTRIQGKIFSKSLNLKSKQFKNTLSSEKIINVIKEEIINLVKSQNLIDLQTPSFLNVKMNLNKKNNLVLLNSKISKIGLIEKIFVQEMNKDYVNLKIKYLGRLENITKRLKDHNITLSSINEEWFIKL